MPSDFCDDHARCDERISRLEKNDEYQWKRLNSISSKLNLILGGIMISPFIVALITLLVRTK